MLSDEFPPQILGGAGSTTFNLAKKFSLCIKSEFLVNSPNSLQYTSEILKIHHDYLKIHGEFLIFSKFTSIFRINVLKICKSLNNKCINIIQYNSYILQDI